MPFWPIRIQDQVFAETIVEDAKTAAQHGFRRALSFSSDAPRKSDARCPVVMVVDSGLCLKTQTVAQRERGAHLEVILHVETGIDHAGAGTIGPASAGALTDRKLNWSVAWWDRSARCS